MKKINTIKLIHQLMTEKGYYFPDNYTEKNVSMASRQKI